MGRGFRNISFGRMGRKALVAAMLATTSVPATAIASASSAAAQTNAQTTFSIPAGPLNRALAAFGRQSGTQVSYEASIASGKTSPGIRGNATREQAISQILRVSGLVYRFSDPTNILITRPDATGGNINADGSLVLDTISVQAPAENAWGPVDGYVATRSAIGTKTGALRIEIPQSISVVGRQEMEDRGVQTLGQAVRYTPGSITDFDGGVQPGYDGVILRGFGAEQYLDGLQFSGWLEPYGTERIEVMRGPTSVLYGQTQPGGMVGAVSKRPTEKPIREVGVLTSEYGGIQGSFDFSGKLTDSGTLLYRLTGLGKNLGTYFENGSEYKRIYIAPAVTWRPGPDTSLTILTSYQYDPAFLALPTVPREGARQGNKYYGSDPSFDNGSYRKAYQIGYAFEHRFNDVFTLRQNLRYTKSEINRQSLGTNVSIRPPTTIASRGGGTNYSDVDHFAVDTNAEAKFQTGPISHTALFGIDYRSVINFAGRGNVIGAVPPLNLLDPQYGLYSGPTPALTQGSETKSRQTGLYAQDQVKWDRWTLLFGGRYDWATSNTYNPFNNYVRTDSMQQRAFTGRIGLVYRLDNGIAPYISYSESFEPQSGTSSPERGSTPFKPTTGQQIEVGIKYEPAFFDGFFTASVYDLRKQNNLTTDPLNDYYYIQTGEIRTRGFEVTGSANITSNLKFVASYSYTDNVYTKDNPDWQGISLVGKAPYGIPVHSASGWIDYTFDYGALDGLGIGFGLRYKGSSYGNSANTFKIPEATLADAAIRYDFGKKYTKLKGLRMSINASNIFNKEYFQTCYNDVFCYYGAARTVTGSLTYRW